MGLFGGKEVKEDKTERLAQEALEKYGLSNLSHEYAAAAREIAQTLAGTGAMEFGSLLKYDQGAYDAVKAARLDAIIKQNWIIIRELNEISKKLDK